MTKTEELHRLLKSIGDQCKTASEVEQAVRAEVDNLGGLILAMYDRLNTMFAPLTIPALFANEEVRTTFIQCMEARRKRNPSASDVDAYNYALNCAHNGLVAGFEDEGIA